MLAIIYMVQTGALSIDTRQLALENRHQPSLQERNKNLDVAVALIDLLLFFAQAKNKSLILSENDITLPIEASSRRCSYHAGWQISTSHYFVLSYISIPYSVYAHSYQSVAALTARRYSAV